MRRRLVVLPVLSVAALLAACGKGSDDLAEPDQTVLVDDLDPAVEIASFSAPAALDEDAISALLDGLCDGDAAAVASQLQAAGLDAEQQAQALDALSAGADTTCPDGLDTVVPQVQQALAPTTTAAPAAATSGATGGGGAGNSSTANATSGSSGSSSSGSSANGGSGASNSSSGSASVGGGDANGTGNQSSTGMTQGVSNSGSSSASNSASAG
jgi:hypothetical protein